jgi:uncharacterized protein
MRNIRWVWDPQKELVNIRKHHLSFTTAIHVFDDPFQISLPDPYPLEERWRTLGLVGAVTLFVVHTMPELDRATGHEVGRIITARKATPRERQAYENG